MAPLFNYHNCMHFISATMSLPISAFSRQWQIIIETNEIVIGRFSDNWAGHRVFVQSRCLAVERDLNACQKKVGHESIDSMCRALRPCLGLVAI